MMMAAGTKKPDCVSARSMSSRDHAVSLRVRTRRLECGLSQTELAQRIGVTFQMVQKYERGTSRIGSGRLQQIAEILDVPVSFFFGIGATPGAIKRVGDADPDDSIFNLLQTPYSVRLLKAFDKIKDRSTKTLVVAVTEKFAGIPWKDFDGI